MFVESLWCHEVLRKYQTRGLQFGVHRFQKCVRAISHSLCIFLFIFSPSWTRHFMPVVVSKSSVQNLIGLSLILPQNHISLKSSSQNLFTLSHSSSKSSFQSILVFFWLFLKSFSQIFLGYFRNVPQNVLSRILFGLSLILLQNFVSRIFLVCLWLLFKIFFTETFLVFLWLSQNPLFRIF